MSIFNLKKISAHPYLSERYMVDEGVSDYNSVDNEEVSPEDNNYLRRMILLLKENPWEYESIDYAFKNNKLIIDACIDGWVEELSHRPWNYNDIPKEFIENERIKTTHLEGWLYYINIYPLCYNYIPDDLKENEAIINKINYELCVLIKNNSDFYYKVPERFKNEDKVKEAFFDKLKNNILERPSAYDSIPENLKNNDIFKNAYIDGLANQVRNYPSVYDRLSDDLKNNEKIKNALFLYYSGRVTLDPEVYHSIPSFLQEKMYSIYLDSYERLLRRGELYKFNKEFENNDRMKEAYIAGLIKKIKEDKYFSMNNYNYIDRGFKEDIRVKNAFNEMIYLKIMRDPTNFALLPKELKNDERIQGVCFDSWLSYLKKEPYSYDYVPENIRNSKEIREAYFFGLKKKLLEGPSIYKHVPEEFRNNEEIQSALIEGCKAVLKSDVSNWNYLPEHVKSNEDLKEFAIKCISDKGNTSLDKIPDEFKDNKEFNNVYLNNLIKRLHKDPLYIDSIPYKFKNKEEIREAYINGLVYKVKYYPFLYNSLSEDLKNIDSIKNAALDSFIEYYKVNSDIMRIDVDIPSEFKDDERVKDVYLENIIYRLKKYPFNYSEIPDKFKYSDKVRKAHFDGIASEIKREPSNFNLVPEYLKSNKDILDIYFKSCLNYFGRNYDIYSHVEFYKSLPNNFKKNKDIKERFIDVFIKDIETRPFSFSEDEIPKDIYKEFFQNEEIQDAYYRGFLRKIKTDNVTYDNYADIPDRFKTDELKQAFVRNTLQYLIKDYSLYSHDLDLSFESEFLENEKTLHQIITFLEKMSEDNPFVYISIEDDVLKTEKIKNNYHLGVNKFFEKNLVDGSLSNVDIDILKNISTEGTFSSENINNINSFIEKNLEFIESSEKKPFSEKPFSNILETSRNLIQNLEKSNIKTNKNLKARIFNESLDCFFKSNVSFDESLSKLFDSKIISNDLGLFKKRVDSFMYSRFFGSNGSYGYGDSIHDTFVNVFGNENIYQDNVWDYLKDFQSMDFNKITKTLARRKDALQKGNILSGIKNKKDLYREATSKKILPKIEDCVRFESELNENGLYNIIDLSTNKVVMENLDEKRVNANIQLLEAELFEDTLEGISKYQMSRSFPGIEKELVPIVSNLMDYCSDSDIRDFLEKFEVSKKQNIEFDERVVKNFTFRILKKEDPMGVILGNLTSCCQTIGGASENAVFDGYGNENAGFLAVFDKRGNLVAQSWIRLGQSNNLYLDNIETVTLYEQNHSLKLAYLEWASQIKNERNYKGIYVGNNYADIDFKNLSLTMDSLPEYDNDGEFPTYVSGDNEYYTDMDENIEKIAFNLNRFKVNDRIQSP